MNTLLFSNGALFIMYVLASEDLMEPIHLLRVTDATSFPFLIPNICIVNIPKAVRYCLCRGNEPWAHWTFHYTKPLPSRRAGDNGHRTRQRRQIPG
jgi:hypothetical protein